MAKAPWIKTAVALTLALGLAACDSGDETPPEPTTGESANESAQPSQEAIDQADADQEMPETAENGNSDAPAADDIESGEETGTTTSSTDAAIDGTGTEAGDVGQDEADVSWENTEDDVNEALKETERRFEEAEKELEEQFKAAEEQDVQQNQELEIQPEEQ